MAQIHGGRKTSRVCARRDFATFLHHILSARMMTPPPRQAPGIRTHAYLEQGRRGVKTIAVKRSIGEVVQSRRRPLLGPSPG